MKSIPEPLPILEQLFYSLARATDKLYCTVHHVDRVRAHLVNTVLRYTVYTLMQMHTIKLDSNLSVHQPLELIM